MFPATALHIDLSDQTVIIRTDWNGRIQGPNLAKRSSRAVVR
jgi:hypothetical protein